MGTERYSRAGWMMFMAAFITWGMGSTGLAADSVRVGLINSFSGPLADAGKEAHDAVKVWSKFRGGNSAIEVLLCDASDTKQTVECASRLVKIDRVKALIGPYSSSKATEVAKAIAGGIGGGSVPYVAMARIDEEIRRANPSVFSMPVPYGTLETAAIAYIGEHLKPSSLDVVATHAIFVVEDSGWQRTLPRTQVRPIILDPSRAVVEQFSYKNDLVFIAADLGLQGLDLARAAMTRGVKKVVLLWSAGEEAIKDLPPNVYVVTFARPTGTDSERYESLFMNSVQRKPSYYAFFAAAALDVLNEAVLKLGGRNVSELTRVISEGHLKTLLGTMPKADAGYLSLVVPIAIVESRDGRLTTVLKTGGGNRDCKSQSNCGDGCCKKVEEKCPDKTCSDG